MITLADYPQTKTAWCPGCGNFGILSAVRKALVNLQMAPYQVLFVSGIGQAGKLPQYTKCNMLNGLHGRALPAATGAKLANHELNVFIFGGDGDAYGEGGNHFIHAMHRNVNMTYVVHNNQVYGLTKGQASPTSDTGYVSKTTPLGARAQMNPLAMAVACDCSFVARAFSGDVEHLSSIIQQAVEHRGFAFIDVLQPCVTFNHVNTSAWYRERIYKVEQDSGHDSSDRVAAFKKSLEWGTRIPTGVIYRAERPVYEEQLPQLGRMPLVRQKLMPDVERLLEEFT